MKVTIRDIAKELGISTAAVSKALNDLPGVSDGLRLKVKQTAQQMGYTKYLKASMVNAFERSMKFIVVLYGPVGGVMIEELQHGIDPAIRKKGYYELRYMIDTYSELHSEETKELFLMRIAEEKGVAGVVSCYIHLSDVLIAKLYQKNIPVVLVESQTDYGRCARIDNVRASHKAVTKLIELGRKRIGLVIPPEGSEPVWNERVAGYKRALRDKGVTYDPQLIEFESWVSVESGARATRRLLSRIPDVDAILYGSDRQAHGGLKVLRDMKKDVPRDIAVIGFDDAEINSVLRPSLSSVRQPIRKMAETAMGLLFDSIEKNDMSARTVALDTELVLRGSCLEDFQDESWA